METYLTDIKMKNIFRNLAHRSNVQFVLKAIDLQDQFSYFAKISGISRRSLLATALIHVFMNIGTSIRSKNLPFLIINMLPLFMLKQKEGYIHNNLRTDGAASPLVIKQVEGVITAMAPAMRDLLLDKRNGDIILSATHRRYVDEMHDRFPNTPVAKLFNSRSGGLNLGGIHHWLTKDTHIYEYTRETLDSPLTGTVTPSGVLKRNWLLNSDISFCAAHELGHKFHQAVMLRALMQTCDGKLNPFVDITHFRGFARAYAKDIRQNGHSATTDNEICIELGSSQKRMRVAWINVSARKAEVLADVVAACILKDPDESEFHYNVCKKYPCTFEFVSSYLLDYYKAFEFGPRVGRRFISSYYNSSSRYMSSHRNRPLCGREKLGTGLFPVAGEPTSSHIRVQRRNRFYNMPREL